MNVKVVFCFFALMIFLSGCEKNSEMSVENNTLESEYEKNSETSVENHIETEKENIAPESDYDLLYNKGLDTVNILSKLAKSDEYIESVLGSMGSMNSQEIKDYRENLNAGDYDNVKSMYAAMFGNEQARNLLVFNNVNLPKDDDVKKYMEGKIIFSLPNLINSHNGVEALAFSSALMGNTSFVYDGNIENAVCVYNFETGYPIIVVFENTGSGTIMANGTFLFDETFKDIKSEQEFSKLIKDKAMIFDADIKKVY